MTVVHLSRLEDLAEEVPASGGRVVRVEVLDFNHRTKVPQITEHQLHILVRAKNGDGEILSVDLVENRAREPDLLVGRGGVVFEQGRLAL